MLPVVICAEAGMAMALNRMPTAIVFNHAAANQFVLLNRTSPSFKLPGRPKTPGKSQNDLEQPEATTIQDGCQANRAYLGGIFVAATHLILLSGVPEGIHLTCFLIFCMQFATLACCRPFPKRA
jgi:hypothetical protein